MMRATLTAAVLLATTATAFAASSTSTTGSSTSGSSTSTSGSSTSTTGTASTSSSMSYGTSELPGTKFDESYQPGRATRSPPGAYTGEFGVPAEQRYIPFSGDLPGCEDHDTVWWIKNRFDHTQSTFWNSSLEMVDIDRIEEVGFRSNGTPYIPRRYCVGRAALSDSTYHTVIYQIVERGGVAGFGDGFEWCVVGYDHLFAYAPSCSVLRPLVARYANDRVTFPQ